MAFTIKINETDHVVDVDDDTPLLRVICDVQATVFPEGCGRHLFRRCARTIATKSTERCWDIITFGESGENQ